MDVGAGKCNDEVSSTAAVGCMLALEWLRRAL